MYQDRTIPEKATSNGGKGFGLLPQKYKYQKTVDPCVVIQEVNQKYHKNQKMSIIYKDTKGEVCFYESSKEKERLFM